MGGKAVLFLVVGFSMIFLVIGQNFGRITIDAAKNYSGYYSRTVSKNIAESGANLAVGQIYKDPLWTTGYNNVSLNNGKLNVTVTLINPVLNIRMVTSTGIYNSDTSTVQVTLSLTYFSKFGYYSENENGIWWATGDTVNGPFHTQDCLNVNGHPVFNPGKNGFVSTYLGLNKANWNSSPILVNNATIRTGDTLSMPPNGVSTVENMAASGGYVFSGHSDVYIVFQNDYLKYSFGGRNPTWTTVKISTLAPNGTIVANNADLHIQGVVQGQVTIAATGTKSWWGSWGGNIYLDDNIVYSTDPRTNPNSTDLLGIVAEQNVYVTNNSANDNNINIDAAIYAENGGFGAEDYNRRPASGTINLYGGITEKNREPVGTLDRFGNVITGFNKSYNYDPRLMSLVPPNFPHTSSYQIVSWYE